MSPVSSCSPTWLCLSSDEARGAISPRNDKLEKLKISALLPRFAARFAPLLRRVQQTLPIGPFCPKTGAVLSSIPRRNCSANDKVTIVLAQPDKANSPSVCGYP